MKEEKNRYSTPKAVKLPFLNTIQLSQGFHFPLKVPFQQTIKPTSIQRAEKKILTVFCHKSVFLYRNHVKGTFLTKKPYFSTEEKRNVITTNHKQSRGVSFFIPSIRIIKKCNLFKKKCLNKKLHNINSKFAKMG